MIIVCFCRMLLQKKEREKKTITKTIFNTKLATEHACYCCRLFLITCPHLPRFGSSNSYVVLQMPHSLPWMYWKTISRWLDSRTAYFMKRNRKKSSISRPFDWLQPWFVDWCSWWERERERNEFTLLKCFVCMFMSWFCF